MLEKWLKQTIKRPNGFVFNVFEIEEQGATLDEIKNYLGEQTLNSYRSPNFLKKLYKNKSQDQLLEYIKQYVFPNATEELPDYTFRKNTKQGDFGEILSVEIVKEFRKLDVPLYKFRWKFNNNRSLFCTDIFAHNQGDTITDLRYYEVKTKTTYDKQIGVDACKCLEREIPTEALADFLSKEAFSIAEKLHEKGTASENKELLQEAKIYYERCNKYNDIVINPKKYNKSFEIILVIEKSKFKEDILRTLNDLPPAITPLEVTIILLNNLGSLVENAYESATAYAVKNTYG